MADVLDDIRQYGSTKQKPSQLVAVVGKAREMKGI